MSIAPGTRIGPYGIEAFLGAGGMGEVYRARDSRLGRDVAVKVLPAALSENQDRLSRFELEARAASALNHPSILTVHDVGLHDGAPYIVCELLEGGTLRERLDLKPLAPRKAIEHATQIARGLAAAHDKGIVHRDVKPENLFVTTDGRVKILDFGLAKLVRHERPAAEGEATETFGTDLGTQLGTVGYVSPEQIRGHAADHRSDLFSLGAVLYEMLSGRRAFKGETGVQTLNAILTEEPPDLAAINPAVSPSLERIVRRCLEKDPEHRFHSAHDLAFALEGLAGTSASVSTREAALRARRRGLLAALTALIVVALTGVAFIGGRRTAEPSLPLFQRLTFRQGAVLFARYAPDGQTVVYAASWEGDPKLRLFSTRVQSPESTQLDLPDAGLLGVSRTGELALALGHPVAPYWRGGTLARVPLAGGTPRAVLDGVAEADWSPDGRALAVVRVNGGWSRLEFPIGTTLFEASGIWDPRVSPDGNRVAFRHGPRSIPGIESSLAVVDREGNKTELSAGWTWARGLAWAPDGNEIWLTGRRGGPMALELWAVALSGKERLVMRLPSWTVIQDIAPDGRVLLTQGTLRAAARCLPPGADRERDVSWFEASRVLDLSPDGRTLLFAEEGTGEKGALYVRDTTEALAPIRLGEVSFGAALSPNRQWAAVATPREIILLPMGAGQLRRLNLSGVSPIYIRWFRDGKHCVLAGVEPGHRWRTYSLDVDDGRLEPLAPEGLVCMWPSSDGRELLCIDEGEARYTVYSRERGEGRPAPGLEAWDEVLDWGTDGAIYVLASPRERGEIERLDLRTGKRALWRQIVFPDRTGLLGGGPDLLVVAPQAGAYCYTAWWGLLDLYQVEGLK